MATNDSPKKGYDWKFCKIGGVTRVKITSGDDIAHLDELDQKLWTVLSCPIVGLEFDAKTLEMLDINHDGKIRVNEVKAAAKWLTTVLENPDKLLEQSDTIELDEFDKDNPDGLRLYNSAKQILSNLGLDKTSISLADASDSIAIFAKTALNGDGVITEQSTDDEALKDIIASAIATVGSVDDRSGLKGINAELLDKFYTACADYKAWKDAGVPQLFPYGENTAAALDACNAIKDKVSDYFMRCKLAAFNSASTSNLDISADRIGQISAKDLSACNDEISAYPIARITGKLTLPLDSFSINPAWQDAFAKVKTLVLDNELRAAVAITEQHWKDILAKFNDYTAWMASKKGSEVESLGLEKIEKILADGRKSDLVDLIEKDKVLAEESAAIDDVEKFLRYYKNFYKLLKNFVTFSDFYSRDPKNIAVFQAGTLFIDQRSTDLCIKVADMGKQGEVSDLSGMYIVYCDCSSKVLDKKMMIAAVLTEGDIDSIRVGKNAVFYDRDGNDWDAVVTKILDNPISVPQAFWTPYRKLGRFVYDKINKAASDKNASAEASLTERADNVKMPAAEAAAPAAEAEAAPAAAAADSGKIAGFDIAKFAGIFAAIGIAIGAIGMALSGLATAMTANWYNLPLLILAIIVLISGPSMFLAWLKLRRRNLAPVLNANGWAINSRIIVNSRFGATFTKVAKYPKVNVEDPYASRFPIWAIVVICLIAAIGITLAVFAISGNWDVISGIFVKK